MYHDQTSLVYFREVTEFTGFENQNIEIFIMRDCHLNMKQNKFSPVIAKENAKANGNKHRTNRVHRSVIV
jgi:hypothetical protein